VCFFNLLNPFFMDYMLVRESDISEKAVAALVEQREISRDYILSKGAIIWMGDDSGKIYPGRIAGGGFASSSFRKHGNFNHVCASRCDWYDFEDKSVYTTSTHNVRLMTAEEYVMYAHLFDDDFFSDELKGH
jgi:hypothetical protein